jgi:type II secretory ATPase GspE/PulE/Tfp pilus assembly ATPase PilB-like protein
VNTGFRGRLPLVEWIRVTESMRRQITAGTVQDFQAKPSLREHGDALVHRGLTSASELARALGAEQP